MQNRSEKIPMIPVTEGEVTDVCEDDHGYETCDEQYCYSQQSNLEQFDDRSYKSWLISLENRFCLNCPDYLRWSRSCDYRKALAPGCFPTCCHEIVTVVGEHIEKQYSGLALQPVRIDKIVRSFSGTDFNHIHSSSGNQESAHIKGSVNIRRIVSWFETSIRRDMFRKISRRQCANCTYFSESKSCSLHPNRNIVGTTKIIDAQCGNCSYFSDSGCKYSAGKHIESSSDPCKHVMYRSAVPICGNCQYFRKNSSICTKKKINMTAESGICNEALMMNFAACREFQYISNASVPIDSVVIETNDDAEINQVLIRQILEFYKSELVRLRNLDQTKNNLRLIKKTMAKRDLILFTLHNDGEIRKGIRLTAERYNISEQAVSNYLKEMKEDLESGKKP